MSIYELVDDFRQLFRGLDTAFGTGQGRWIKRAPTREDFIKHLQGEGPGIGIAPLMPDNNVWFASIDLDEPDFEGARDMQRFIPGVTWLERSRSGNAHIHAFFSEPLEAWVAQGILKYAIDAAGFEGVEVFPKNHDFAKVKLGNYINLPYHGEDRPILEDTDDAPMALSEFIYWAQRRRIDPRRWRQRGALLMLEPPREREKREGKVPLHVCAEHIIEGCLSGERPITEGHRAAVWFAVSKMFHNAEGYDRDESWELISEANAACPDRLDPRELRRIFNNAAEFTSTGCDDPLVIPFISPECQIVHRS